MPSKNKVFIVDDRLPYLFDDINYPVGGATVQAFAWFHGFSEKFDVTILSNSKKNFTSDDINVIQYPRTGGSPFGLIRAIRMLNKTIKKEKPEIVFVTVAGLNAFIWGILTLFNKLYYIQRISNDIVYEKNVYRKKIGFIKNFLSRIGIRHAKLVLVQNDYQYKNLNGIVPSENILKVHNPYKSKYTTINPEEEDERSYIGWVGLFQYQKNLPALFEIAQQCPNLNFRIAGKDSAKVDSETLGYIQKLKELPNVAFVGMLDRKEIINFFSKAKCLLNTSHYEGFSNTYLEAFSVGTPVVTRSKTDPDDIIKNNQLGLVAKDYSELPNLLQKINSQKLNESHIIQYLEKFHNPVNMVEALERKFNSTK